MVTEESSIAVEENSNVSKVFYKLFIWILRILPMIMAGLYLLNTILSYFGIDLELISYIAGVGLLPWLFILISSYLFRFCGYHRMFLWYIAVNNIICWIDYNFTIPISDWNYLVLHMIVAGLFLFLILFLKIKCEPLT